MEKFIFKEVTCKQMDLLVNSADYPQIGQKRYVHQSLSRFLRIS